MNLIHLFLNQEKKFISALDKLDVLQNTSFQVSVLFVHLLTYYGLKLIAKRASDVITQARLRQTNWNGDDFEDFFKDKSWCS